MNKRWYDFDPTISYAIKLLEQSEDKIKKYCLDYIIEQAKNDGVEFEDDVNSKFDFIWQRQTDNSSHFFEAMEYLKRANLNFQHNISLDIIKYINELEKNIRND
ncbi:MAG: hypothetical protein E7Z91_04445 [Cyanobacteria bacterium SIG30]|nr:hypothetical protein [Cyanobacteria bacterium SIG30]